MTPGVTARCHGAGITGWGSRLRNDGLGLTGGHDLVDHVVGPAAGEVERGLRCPDHGPAVFAHHDEPEFVAGGVLHPAGGVQAVDFLLEPVGGSAQDVEFLLAVFDLGALAEPRLHGEDEERIGERSDHDQSADQECDPAEGAWDKTLGAWGGAGQIGRATNSA